MGLPASAEQKFAFFFPPVSTLFASHWKMFALLVQYSKLASVLTGLNPLTAPPFYKFSMTSYQVLAGILILSPPLGHGPMAPVFFTFQTIPFVFSSSDRPVQVKAPMTVKVLATTSLGPYGTLPVEMSTTATVAGAIWLVMCVRS